MKRYLYFFLFFSILIGFSCAPPPVKGPLGKEITVRILLKEYNKKVKISGEPLFIKAGRKTYNLGNNIWVFEARNGKLYIYTSGKRLNIGNVDRALLYSRNGVLRLNRNRYRGQIKISASVYGLKVINILPMEDYLKGVVPREIGIRPPSEIEAMKAQAVAARTYAYSHLHPERDYDMDNTVSDQVYGGMSSESDITNRAVEETKGIIAVYKNKPIDAKYHSTCGGVTSSNEDEWGGNPVPYLRPVVDKDKNGYFCQQSHHFSWKHKFEKREFFNLLRENIKRQKGRDPGIIRNVILKKRNKRVFEMKIIATNGEYSFRGLSIRKVFSGVNAPGNFLRSRYFNIVSKGDSIIIEGHGFGHGVGMCQYGAMGMAQRGYTFDKILKHYYKGINLKKLY